LTTFFGLSVSGGFMFLNGTGSIATGLGSLSVSGTGAVQLDGTLTGGLTLSGGTVAMLLGASISGNITMNGGSTNADFGGLTKNFAGFDLNGGEFNLDNGIFNVSSLSGTGGQINLVATNGAAQFGFGSDNGTSLFEGNASIAISTNLVKNGAGTSTLSGVISGGGALGVLGGGSLILTGANTFTGQTNITSGNLNVTGSGKLASTSIIVEDGTLTTDTDTLDAGSSIDVETNGTFTSSGTDTFASISQSGGTINGTSVQTLTGAFTQSGGTLEGTVDINTISFSQSGGAIVEGDTKITSSGAQILSGGTIAGVLDGLGAVTVQTGTTLITGSIAANVTIASGVLTVFSGTALSDTANLTINAGALLQVQAGETVGKLSGGGNIVLQTLGSFTTNSNANSVFSGVISETGSAARFKKLGTGTLTLTGVNTYDTQTNIEGGTLKLSGAGSIANSNAIAMFAGTTLDIADTTNGATVNDLFNGSVSGFANINLGGKSLDVMNVDARVGNLNFIGGAGADAVAFSLATLLSNYSLATDAFTNWTSGLDTISLSGNALNNTLTGSVQNEVIFGNGGSDVIQGGAGSDTLIGGTNSSIGDTLVYSASSAGVTVSLFANTASGGDAAGDTISGFENLTGSTHNDTLSGNAAANVLRGEDGVSDTLSYASSNAAVTVNLASNVASGGHAQGDTISGFENLLGSAFADSLTGSTGANDIRSNAGNDSIYLGAGAGADFADGGDDFDTLSYYSQTQGAIINMANQVANAGAALGDTFINIERINGSNTATDTIRGDANDNTFYGYGGADSLFGEAGGDTLIGGAGDDSLYGGAGIDIIDGGANFDTASYYSEVAGAIIDLNFQTANAGSALGDSLIDIERINGSNTGADSLTGNDNSNYLVGYGGVDTLLGGGGDDTLRGGLGADILSGNAGADKFRYDAVNEGGDSISTVSTLDDFQFLRTAFGNLAGANVAAINFLSRASGNAATTINHRFIFDETTDTLWFDSNGTGAGGLTMIADIGSNTTLLHTDLLLV
jgi:autotransporter-associated beta strand protein